MTNKEAREVLKNHSENRHLPQPVREACALAVKELGRTRSKKGATK